MHGRVFSFLQGTQLGVNLLGCMLTPLEGLADCFPEQPHSFTCSPEVRQASSFSTLPPAVSPPRPLQRLLSAFLVTGCVVCLCGFDLHFPDG